MIAAKRKNGIDLTILGAGTNNLNDALMQRLAHAGNGQAAYLDSLLEARKIFVKELGSTMTPIADDVKLQIEFNPAAVAKYRLSGYETRKLQRTGFLDDRVAGGQVGAGHAVTAIYEILPAGPAVRHFEPLRYQEPAKDVPSKGRSETMPAEELAFLRLRYRLPGSRDNLTMEQAITGRVVVSSLQAASDDIRFSVAVAGFAQLLRCDDAVRWARGPTIRPPLSPTAPGAATASAGGPNWCS